MFRSLITRGLVQTLVATSLVSTFALTGCGTNASTAPQFVSVEEDDSSGEVPLPGRVGMPRPIALAVSDLTVNGAHLSWVSPGDGYDAIITLNGYVIGSTAAADGFFNDTLAKHAGNYTWGVCFAMGKRMGTAGEVSAVLQESPGGEDGRTGQRPDNGND